MPSLVTAGHDSKIDGGRTVNITGGKTSTVLHEAGFTPQDYDLRLDESYPQLDHVCQYKESNWAFM